VVGVSGTEDQNLPPPPHSQVALGGWRLIAEQQVGHIYLNRCGKNCVERVSIFDSQFSLWPTTKARASACKHESKC